MKVREMNLSNIGKIIKRVYESRRPSAEDIKQLLLVDEQKFMEKIFDFANEVKHNSVGNEVLLRGIVEFSNFCRNRCAYCGINSDNAGLQRYKLTEQEILQSVSAVDTSEIDTVVLQSGEDIMDALWLRDIIKEIKLRFNVFVTLCLGEKDREDYKIWKDAGADRYLLKIETTDRALYQRLHPGMSFENRLRCLRDLRDLGYEVGSGNIVGLNGQTIESLVQDILFFKQERFDMVAIGPYVPVEIPLYPKKEGFTTRSLAKVTDLSLCLKVLALTRIIMPGANIPATTALADWRGKALDAGANVLMRNFTPDKYKEFYKIYPRAENFGVG